jgi:hypothetical protein
MAAAGGEAELMAATGGGAELMAAAGGGAELMAAAGGRGELLNGSSFAAALVGAGGWTWRKIVRPDTRRPQGSRPIRAPSTD